MDVREIAQDKVIQVSTGVGVPVVANAETLARWYDPYWQPIWEILPWSQLATIIGIGWIGYMAYVTFTDRNKSK